ncbi:protein ALTERED PHOSPHATE STARVATION RESPONSE 1-like [Pyrus communis]|uniref:protein ALTERED PHOSPHATE STARVATION RESPONSE 1-like n=1 Tax=Pyrus communis TaxID=23211 RepID=UPI0035BF5AF8
MGCTSSKLDDLPAVALCRERCGFLDEAIHQRYAFAEAHIAYIHSLRGIGRSLHLFIEQEVGNSSGSPPSPHLNLPPARKGQTKSSPPRHSHSNSNSGSHLHFHSDSDDDSGSLHHSDHSSPLHDTHHGGHIDYMEGGVQEGFNSYPDGFMRMNYMKNKATPSVVHRQKPVNPEKVYQLGESSSSSNPYYGYQNSNFYPDAVSNPYSEYGGGFNNYNGGGGGYNYGGGGGGYTNYGNSSPPVRYGAPSPQAPASSSSKPAPPPPPSPPRASAWDFLNPFEAYEKSYSVYTPSRDSKEVRDEEGIPELEDEGYQQEVVKEVQRDHKHVVDGGRHSKAVLDDEAAETQPPSLYQARPSVGTDGGGVEYEVPVVEKKIVDEEERREDRGNGGDAAKARPGSRDAFEVAREIEVQFQRASESGNEIAKMLEVGKLPHNRKHVSSKMMSLVSSQPSTSAEPSTSAGVAAPAPLGFDEELMLRSKNLSSTLHKLYLWEKKLYNEVKAEEKMRVIHDRKVRKLKHLDERGAEAHKVDKTRTLTRSLSTKIKIAIQVVDKISVTINKIRDEELWPQLNELIQGLTRMWKCMLECHSSQCQTIREARGLGPIGSGKKRNDVHLDATLQLEHALINWTFRFSTWISAQKGYVRALNKWLLKCLLYEPEETADGIVPFSPGRIGAPPIFVICNQWSQALENVSEREVVESMRIFTMSVLQTWEQDKLEMRQRMVARKDPEKQVKNLDRKDQKIQKEIQALDKKIVLASGDGDGLSVAGQIVYQSDTRNSTLQASLQRIFEAMERFTDSSTKVYEELLQRNEEERLARAGERVS